MNLNKIPEYIFEASWEVCNMVGGIYTVLSTRAATLKQNFGDKLVFIGPDVWTDNYNPYFEELPQLMPEWVEFTQNHYHIFIRVGRWKIPGEPLAVLVDFMPLMAQKDEIYGHVWSKFEVNSMPAYGDYDESSMFGFASGMVIDSYYRFFKITKNQEVVAHFNEWMTTFGAFYIQENIPEVATVFTTHATSIGRSIAGNHKPLYDYMSEYNGDQMAYELNMVSKHSAEKVAAHCVDCFTTVSDITAIECTQLLEKEPDVVTPNGFENDFVPKGKNFNLKRQEARNLLVHVAETLLGYELKDDCLLVGTAGRYEYKNKGIDTFIESLKYLYDFKDMTREVVAFIMVPAWVKFPRADLGHSLLHPETKLYSYNRITTHELHEYYADNVMGALNWFHIFNTKNERVKAIFVPAYLNGADGIFNKSYYDLLIGLDLTVFPSYYEPWGYTPLESVAFSVPTITTDLSGFGQWVATNNSQVIEMGVGVIHRSDYNGNEVARNIAAMIYDFSNASKAETDLMRKNAAAVAKKALWKNFIKYYFKAYSYAINAKDKRLELKKQLANV
ncbi:MAG: glycosyl transferase [Porphyromonadaceae bacterium CG2_30_38_12]|nr:MAG: glycosyl transferase [Porphyromonadaceae bacterium CG2_30_38_12]